MRRGTAAVFVRSFAHLRGATVPEPVAAAVADAEPGRVEPAGLPDRARGGGAGGRPRPSRYQLPVPEPVG
ncbi:hypothetical protein KNE206_50250 [Kitasatospora sp. NE20-6]